MNKLNQHPDTDEMVAGMIAVATRANGKKALTEEQATLLVQGHISASESYQGKQNSTDRLQGNYRGFYPQHSTCALFAQQENQDQADHLPPIHQQEQSTPTLTLQCK